MKRHFVRRFATVMTLGAIMMLGACKKKVAQAPTPPPPPPPPPAPTASISVSPNSIQAGGSASLAWQTTNATDVSIDGIGAVQANGTQAVSPTESTTYHLTAKGSGGTQEASTRLTVTQPPPPPPPPPAPSISDADLFNQNIKDIYFDFDKSDIRSDQAASVQADGSFLTQHPAFNLTIEGHCDERGSIDYNIALGDKRASAVKQALISAGVSADRINTISYGKERPFCTDHDETCWQQNRRGHFVYRK
jgi:peptidoglycan-associated lipoprotein